MRSNRVKALLRAGQPALGTWLTLGSVLAARYLARAGFNWLTVDAEHSLVGIETLTHMLGTIADAGCTALARVPSNRHDHIKRVLDNGAHGVVVPMVNTRAEALAAVSACKYPPSGNRSVGGGPHVLNWDTNPAEYQARANDELLVILQCEHICAVQLFDDIYSVPGVDVVFVGPNDLAASMKAADGTPANDAVFNRALSDILSGCQRLGVVPGIHAHSLAEAKQRIAEGWKFIAVASELKLMLDATRNLLGGLGLTGSQSELAKY